MNTDNQSEIKLNGIRVNLTVFFLIYKIGHYLIDLWNLFFDKLFFKNE